MMTIAGGTLLGLRPRDAAEFSFLLGLPTLGAACLYKLGRNLAVSARAGAEPVPAARRQRDALGLAVAAVSHRAGNAWLVSFLTRHGLAAFGWYRRAGGIAQRARAPGRRSASADERSFRPGEPPAKMRPDAKHRLLRV
jgi:undecaprenyl-diphosphatase